MNKVISGGERSTQEAYCNFLKWKKILKRKNNNPPSKFINAVSISEKENFHLKKKIEERSRKKYQQYLQISFQDSLNYLNFWNGKSLTGIISEHYYVPDMVLTLSP